MITVNRFALLLAGCLMMPAVSAAQRQTDVDAINRLIDQFGALEDAMDMTAQAKLMTADRVLPPNAPPDLVKAAAAVSAAAITLVLEKRDGDWKIVHTHVSSLAPQN